MGQDRVLQSPRTSADERPDTGSREVHAVGDRLTGPDGFSPRQTGEDAEHTTRLAGARRHASPILVHRPTMRVIDGMHRLLAARRRGRETIDAEFFDGSVEDAFIRAVPGRHQARPAIGILADRKLAAAPGAEITSAPVRPDGGRRYSPLGKSGGVGSIFNPGNSAFERPDRRRAATAAAERPRGQAACGRR